MCNGIASLDLISYLLAVLSHISATSLVRKVFIAYPSFWQHCVHFGGRRNRGLCHSVRSSRAAIPEPIGISQMRRLKDKVFRKKVGVSPNDNDLTRSQHYPVSDYVPADVGSEGKF